MGSRPCVRRRPSLWAAGSLAGVCTLVLVALSNRSWAMHHVILSYPFFIIATAAAWHRIKSKGPGFGRRMGTAILLLIVCLNLICYPKLFWLKPVYWGHSPGFAQLNRVLNQQFASRYIIINIDWGFYFLKVLYGPRDQGVFYVRSIDEPGVLQDIIRIARRHQRHLLFIGYERSFKQSKLLSETLPNLRELKLDFDLWSWRVWFEP